MKYSKGSLVKMNEIAVENYGERWDGVTLRVVLVAHSTEEHPGYDESVYPEGLYDLERVDTGEYLPMSLYDYELKRA